MRDLTFRTTSQRREGKEHEQRKPEPPPAAEDQLRGKRVRLSSKHPAYYYYNKSARGKWNRASQVVEGMRWNAYKSSGKETPLPSPLLVPEFAPMMAGRMRELDGEKMPERHGMTRAKEGHRSGGPLRRAKGEDIRALGHAIETPVEGNARHEGDAAEGHGIVSAAKCLPDGCVAHRHLEHDLALHESIMSFGGLGHGEKSLARRDWVISERAPEGRHASAPKPRQDHAAPSREDIPAPLSISGQTASTFAAERPHIEEAPDSSALNSHIAPVLPSQPLTQNPAMPHTAPAQEPHASAHDAQTADSPRSPAAALQDIRVPKGPGYISSAAKKVYQLKVARADAQPPGDI